MEMALASSGTPGTFVDDIESENCTREQSNLSFTAIWDLECQLLEF
jgi:hypothetical protein